MKHEQTLLQNQLKDSGRQWHAVAVLNCTNAAKRCFLAEQGRPAESPKHMASLLRSTASV